MSKKQFYRLLAALYAAAFLLLALERATAWQGLRGCRQKELPLAAAQHNSLLDDRTWYSFGPGSLLSSDGDPQLVWQLGERVSGLRMTIRASKPVLGPQLYYTTAPGQGYDLARRLEPACSDPAAGVYEFWLPRAVYVDSLRLDPTEAAGAMMELEVLLNPPVAPRRLWPGAAALLAALAAPPLLALALREVLWALQAVPAPSAAQGQRLDATTESDAPKVPDGTAKTPPAAPAADVAAKADTAAKTKAVPAPSKRR